MKTKKLPVADFLVDSKGKVLQMCIVDNGIALPSTPVKFEGNDGIYENENYTPENGAVQFFTKALWSVK